MILTSTAQAHEPAETAAARLARDLAEGRYDAITAAFDPAMAKALPEPVLVQTWSSVTATAGKVVEIGKPRSERRGAFTVVSVPLRCERAALDLELSFADGKVAGLLVRPALPASAPWSPPAYSDAAAFREVEVTIGAAPWQLPGTLSLPTGARDVPAVVLIHGSGPHDRNESIGPNRPFQDLAHGLASRGVAVLRYDKRSKTYPQAFASSKSFTVREEVIDDALAAVVLLRRRPEIDAGRIMLLGHSLGGTLAPRIAKADPAIGAIVVLAGATRPLPELIVEQTEYLAGLPGFADERARAEIATLKAEAGRALAAKADDRAPILGIPPSYWADLNAYDAAVTAASLPIPMLILQGGRDYQVTAKDLERFRTALAGRADAAIVEFERLNHLFMAGEGKSTPAEYQRPGHVAPEVIDTIAAFALRAGRP